MQCQDMHALSVACYIPAVLKYAPGVCRQPLAPLPQPHSGPPQQQQQQHHSLSQQCRQAAGTQQPVVHEDFQHKPPQQQQRQPQQLQQAQQQQQQQKRRVREDENSVMVRGNRYTKLECVGRGGSSKVFKVRIMIVMHTSHLAGTQQKDGSSTGTLLSGTCRNTITASAGTGLDRLKNHFARLLRLFCQNHTTTQVKVSAECGYFLKHNSC